MKPDKYKVKEKLIRRLDKRLSKLWRYRRRIYADNEETEWIPLEEPIRHGYWAEFVPIAKFRGTEKGIALQKAINVISSPVWSSNRNFTKRDPYKKGQIINIYPSFHKVGTWRKYQELPFSVKSNFERKNEQSSWGGWFDYYYPTKEFRTQIELKISKCYITHTKIPNSEKLRELDEIEKHYNELVKFHPKGQGYHWSDPKWKQKEREYKKQNYKYFFR